MLVILNSAPLPPAFCSLPAANLLIGPLPFARGHMMARLGLPKPGGYVLEEGLTGFCCLVGAERFGVRQLVAAFLQASLLAGMAPWGGDDREQARGDKAAASCRSPKHGD